MIHAFTLFSDSLEVGDHVVILYMKVMIIGI